MKLISTGVPIWMTTLLQGFVVEAQDPGGGVEGPGRQVAGAHVGCPVLRAPNPDGPAHDRLVREQHPLGSAVAAHDGRDLPAEVLGELGGRFGLVSDDLVLGVAELVAELLAGRKVGLQADRHLVWTGLGVEHEGETKLVAGDGRRLPGKGG